MYRPARSARVWAAAGVDPSAELVRVAQAQGFGDKLQMISLGQGQGPLAQAVIELAAKQGALLMLLPMQTSLLGCTVCCNKSSIRCDYCNLWKLLQILQLQEKSHAMKQDTVSYPGL